MRISTLCCSARLHFMAGMQLFPAFQYRRLNAETQHYVKKFIFGPPGSEFVTWTGEHTWESFLARAKALNNVYACRMCGGFNSICLVCGKASGVTVIDQDSKRGIDQSCLEALIPPDCPREITPSHGYHNFLAYNPECRSTRFDSLDVDILNDGKFCVISPSNIEGAEHPYRGERPFNWPIEWLRLAHTPGHIPIKADPAVIVLPKFGAGLKAFLYGVCPPPIEPQNSKKKTTRA
jgi:hypothetical protein